MLVIIGQFRFFQDLILVGLSMKQNQPFFYYNIFEVNYVITRTMDLAPLIKFVKQIYRCEVSKNCKEINSFSLTNVA